MQEFYRNEREPVQEIPDWGLPAPWYLAELIRVEGFPVNNSDDAHHRYSLEQRLADHELGAELDRLRTNVSERRYDWANDDQVLHAGAATVSLVQTG